MFRVKDIVKATQGILLQGKDSTEVRGVSTDTRRVRRGELFIAIPGENFDGHDYLSAAAQKSAAAIIISRKVASLPANVCVILVDDSVKAFGRLARWHRDRFDVPVIAVTGSAGKTTTKEMVAAVLSKRYKVLKNVATQNNHIGVPATLLKLNSSHQLAVIECGTNQPGDIGWLGYVVNPTAVVLTTIGESHLELLKSTEGVFKEKFELVKAMKGRGTVIFNADNSYLRSIRGKNLKHRLVSFGVDEPCDVRARSAVLDQKARLNFKVGTDPFRVNTPIRHNVYTALAAIACAKLFKVPVKAVQSAIERFKFPYGRGVVSQIGGWQVIDDSYNANPVSFRSAIETLNDLKVGGRKILVCGDMLELGAQSEALHRSIGILVGRSQINLVLTLGRFSRVLAESARAQNGKIEAHHCGSIETVHNRLAGYCAEGDAILVKGSRGMRLERTIQFLKEKATR